MFAAENNRGIAERGHSTIMKVDAMVEARQVELGDLLGVIWRGKWIVLAVTTIFVVAAVMISLTMPNVYRSEVELKPVEEGGQGVSGMPGLAALGSLAGINIGGGGVDSTDAAIAVLESRRFLVNFARRHDILVPLMAGKDWNEEPQSLRLDPTVYDAKAKQWARPAKPPLGRAPSDEEIYRKLRSILEVQRDPNTQLVTVNVTFVSPVHAQQWASMLVRDLNSELRRRRIGQMDRALQYLEQRIQANRIAGMNPSLEQLYLFQLRERLLAQAREEFALETIDPANFPQFRHGPNRKLMAVAAGVMGIIVGVLIALIAAALRPRRRQEVD